MRYLIVTYDDYFNIPYIRFYEEQLRRQGHSYDIVLWNRSGKQVDLPNAFVFSGKDRRSKLGKILPFLQWRKFTLDVLKQNRYDRLILLTTMPAVLLADRLLGEYRGKFWFDIRDFTYENIPFYKKLVGDLVHAAEAVSISSPAFRSFLPESDRIFLTHNISNQEFSQPRCTLDTAQRPLNIGFVGGIQFVEQNQHLLRKFANNPGYILSYTGKAHLGCDMEPFCRENGIENARFAPAFTNDQKPAIYEGIQLINSVYGCDNNVVRLLLPNRLYDCVLFKKPMLVSKGTYLETVVEQYNLGLAVDAQHDDVVALLEEYLAHFDAAAFDRGCEAFLRQVEADVQVYMAALDAFIPEVRVPAGV